MITVRQETLEVIRQIDEIASGKGLRAAQRRALFECRRMLLRLLSNLAGAGQADRKQLETDIMSTVAKVCELLSAYFCH